LNWRGNPDLRGDDVHRFLRLGEGDTSLNATTFSQRRPRGLFGLVGGQYLPNGGRGWKGKGRRARKHRRDLRERLNGGLDGNAGCDGSRPHRARSGEGSVLRGSCRRRSLERNGVVPSLVVIPPFTNTGSSVPSNKDHVVVGKPLLVKVEVDDKTEPIPLQLLGTRIAIGKSTNRITYGPRPREGRREMRNGIDVLA
jgi:hypothetical protein